MSMTNTTTESAKTHTQTTIFPRELHGMLLSSVTDDVSGISIGPVNKVLNPIKASHASSVIAAGRTSSNGSQSSSVSFCVRTSAHSSVYICDVPQMCRNASELSGHWFVYSSTHTQVHFALCLCSLNSLKRIRTHVNRCGSGSLPYRFASTTSRRTT